MTQLLYTHVSKCIRQLRKREVVYLYGKIPVPAYLKSWQESAGLALAMMLCGMFILEPILWCWQYAGEKMFYEDCTEAEHIVMPYSVFSMLAMLLYFGLLLDLAVLSTKVSAYVLVCIRMLSEVWLFIFALLSTLMTFA